MSQGFLVFAYDNEEIGYGLMALWQARRIKKFLGKPVSIVTDSKTCGNLDRQIPEWRASFDQIILADSETVQQKRYMDVGKDLTFHNVNRIYSYDLTPYDETIVIDTDIIIQSNQLNKLWNNSEDILFCDKSQDIKRRPSPEFEYVNRQSIRFYWATLFYFKKTDIIKVFFDQCKKIRNNYPWYRQMYHFASGPIRNDYAWSTAIFELGGRVNDAWAKTIPWSILHASPKDILVDMSDTAAKVYADNNLIKIVEKDIHIMHKRSLMSSIEKELGVDNV